MPAGRSSSTCPAIRSRKACKSSSGRKTPQEGGEDPLPTWAVNKHGGLRKLVQCHQTVFFSLSLPLMRQQPNYTCMLKNLLKLYCIWTWDSLWGFFVCFLQFWFTLFFPFDETTTEPHLRHHLQDWRMRDEHQNCIWTWRFFKKFYCIFYFYFIYTYFFIYLFLIFLFIFYFQSSLCLSDAFSAYGWILHCLSLLFETFFVCFFVLFF
jgi:hypothetical protein